MTKEQAKREIDSLDFYMQNHTDDYGEESHTAMMMAKDALSRSEIPTSCGDVISRQAVLDLAEWFDLNRQHFIVANLIDEVENMPSVSPQQRTGRWIEVIDETDSLGNKTWHHECSICGSDKSGWGTYKYCPDCGTKMEVVGCTKNI